MLVEVSLGNFTFKEIDFNPTVEAYNQIEDITKVDEKWMEENFRTFIPASFGGLSLSNVSCRMCRTMDKRVNA